MRPIDKFILHVVHNLFPLNEYSEGEMNFLMNKFKEEAEDLNIQISDEQLKKYIERFDQLKNSPKITDKDLRKYSLSKLIKLVTGSAGAETEDENKEDDTPDVVYNEGDITIWNGAKQNNCITYGAGERWCITRPGGSFWGNYRYGTGEPTFYLAKNRALSDNDKLSFVAIQVLNDGRYKFTNRNNSPGMEGPFNWTGLTTRIPWLQEIPNIQNILKYIPLSNAEKAASVYKNNSITIRKWIQLPFSAKKQYLIARDSYRGDLFSDIKNNEFVSKYLPEYPQIATMIAEVPSIVDIPLLLKYLDKFSNQDRRTIIARLRDKLDSKILTTDTPFDVKKLLVSLDKILTSVDTRIYNSKDGKAIVQLNLKDGITVDLFTEDDDYPNIKLNKRTSKYLLDYPELDKIPLNTLIDLVQKEVIDKEVVDKVIENAKKDPNSAIIIKNIDGNEIIFDSNSFVSYKIENGNIKSIPFDSEEVQQVFNTSKDNESFQQNTVNLFKEPELPATINKDALISVINATPYNKRIIQSYSNPDKQVVILATKDSSRSFILMPSIIDPSQRPYIVASYSTREGNWRERQSYSIPPGDKEWLSYFSYLRATNQSFNASQLQTLLGGGGDSDPKKAFIANNPPVANDSTLKPAMSGDTALLINTADPKNSFKISDQSGKLIRANVPSALARQLLGNQAIAAPAAGDIARRGRPVGVPNAPRQPQPAAPAGGNILASAIANNNNIINGFNTIPNRTLRRIPNTFQQVPIVNNRGASRRQNILLNVGRVIAVYESGNSAFYIIQLVNGTRIGSLVIQPGNTHYLITSNDAIQLDSPANLLQALQQRNLAEIHQYMVNEYFDRNPNHIKEFKELLRKHINEKKNANK